jgi:molybdopterin converting factor small subunit
MVKPLSIKINIGPSLVHLTNNQETIDVAGNDVGQCLVQLVGKFPGLKDSLFSKNGKLNNHIDIYVNSESSYPEELAKPVKDGDQIHIVSQLAGG